MRDVKITIGVTGLIKKQIVVLITIGNTTKYYYGATSFIKEMECLGMDKVATLKLLMEIRKTESKFLFKGCSFFAYQKDKLGLTTNPNPWYNKL